MGWHDDFRIGYTECNEWRDQQKRKEGGDDMKIKTIEVGYTYNMGNYESRRLSIVAEPDEGVSISEQLQFIHDQLDEENAMLTAHRKAKGRR